jgi:sialate O-acetylesterase
MIAPLLRTRLAGVVYYQGESNSLASCPVAFACMWPALVADWRRRFGLPALSFLFVQAPPYLLRRPS